MRSPIFYKPNILLRILLAIGITLGALLVLFLAYYTVKIYNSQERPVPVNEQPQISTLNFELDPGVSYDIATNQAALYFYSSENLKIINTKGDLTTDMPLKLSRPAVSTKDNYTLFYDLGGRKVITFNGSKQASALELEENILLASINGHGYMLLITESDLHKCAARVFTPHGEEIFKWNSGNLSVISADISNNNKDITISAINTDEAKIKNHIIMFNITKEKPFTNDVYEGDMYSVLRYSGSYLYCIGSDKTYIYNSYGKCVGTADYSGRGLQRYALDGNQLVLSFSGSSEKTGVAEIVSYNHKGDLIGSHTVLQDFDFLDVKDGMIAVNNGRVISLLNSHCQEKKKINLNFDLRSFSFFGNNSVGIGITASGAELIQLN